MADKQSESYTQILRSSSIIGGASVINILVGLLRNKVVAVLLGPAGVGLIGLLQNLMTTGSTLASLGLGNAGTRQVAHAVSSGDDGAVSTSRRALFWSTTCLAIVGGAVFYLFRGTLADHVLNDPDTADTIGWLALGLSLTVAAGSQGALLNGMRRIGDIARVRIFSAILSTAIGVTAIWYWREQGIALFIISLPLASFILGHWFVARLPRLQGVRARLRSLFEESRVLVRIGSGFMVAGVVVAIGHLAVRTIVQRDLGPAELGQFQAAWIISMTYIGFVLQAMGTDYFPRLSALIDDAAAANELVNQQSEVALLLAGPVLIAMLGLAPWIIELLYTKEFADAAAVLRWQVLGDILKVASWPLGFIILAAGDSKTFMVKETVVALSFVIFTWIGIPRIGIQATGTAFVGMYALNVVLLYWLAARRTGFTWSRRVRVHLAALVGIAAVVFVAGYSSRWAGAVSGVAVSLVLGVFGLARLGRVANIGGPVGRAAELSQKLLARLGVQRD
jgi:PST family polysaccharide transporter